MILREARPEDIPALDALAFRAKAHWGYGPELLEAWRADLATPADSLEQRPTPVVELEGRPAAFAQLDPGTRPWELVSLWVDPPHMGKGLGTKLMERVCALARAQGKACLSIDADPNAAGFYEHRGARRVGEVKAPIPGQPGRVRPQYLIHTGLPPVPVVAALIVDGARVLMGRKPDGMHPAGLGGCWVLPGGRVEAGETEPEAMVREAAEETGLGVRIERPLGQWLDLRPGGATRSAYYLCTPIAGRPKAGDDLQEVRWVPGAELLEALSPPMVALLSPELRAWLADTFAHGAS